MQKPEIDNEPDEYPMVVGGITYNSKEELEERREADALAFAELLYDIYQEDKAKKFLES